MTFEEVSAKTLELITILKKDKLNFIEGNMTNGWTYKLRYNPKKDKTISRLKPSITKLSLGDANE